MDGEGRGLHITIRISYQEKVVSVVDVRGILFHVCSEKEDFPVHAPLVGKTGGDLRDEHEPVLLVLFLVEQPEKLAQLLILLEGAKVIPRFGSTAPGERGNDARRARAMRAALRKR